MSENPLIKHFRQPAIYVKLPSDGQYWANDSLEMPESHELPVYPMTTRDEITLRTPDSLINGTSVVEVVESCCPNIKNAWEMPSVDVDALLMAIRIASYGHEMTITAQCPHCKEAHEYIVDLRNSMAKIVMPGYEQLLEIDGLKIKLRPQPYYSVNKVNMTRFEEQKMMDHLRNADVPEQQRIESFKQQMRKLVDLNLEVVADSTEYIQLPDNTVVSDQKFILEFLNNCETSFTKKLQDHFASLNEQAGTQKEHIICGNADCKKPFDSSMDFDYASFFVTGF